MSLKRIPLLIVLALLVILIMVRAFSPSEIDDVHPGIPCQDSILDRSNVLWVIPMYKNDSIASPEHAQWCSYILSKNKTLGMHGVEHSYDEFAAVRDDAYFTSGIQAFEGCLNTTPTMFKPPQIAFNESNLELLWRHNLEYRGKVSQVFHKVYHCDDTGEFPNWFIKII